MEISDIIKFVKENPMNKRNLVVLEDLLIGFYLQAKNEGKEQSEDNHGGN